MGNVLELEKEQVEVTPIEHKKKSLAINYDWCKSCGLCIDFCPKDCFDENVLGSPILSRPEDCTVCNVCVERCPDFCIYIGNPDEFRQR